MHYVKYHDNAKSLDHYVKHYAGEHDNIPDDVNEQLMKISKTADDAASDLLQKAFESGYKVLLLTNAHGCWINGVQKDGLMPRFFNLMNSHGGVIISTHDYFKGNKVKTIKHLGKEPGFWGKRLGYGDNPIIKVIGAGDKAWDLDAAETLAAQIDVSKFSGKLFRHSKNATAETLKEDLIQLKEDLIQMDDFMG